jgi:hypothetical protein
MLSPSRPLALSLVLLALSGAQAAAEPPAPPPGAAAPAPAPPPGPAGAVATGVRIELPLQNGKTLSGVLEGTDAAEVVLLVGPGERRRVPWSQLAPLGVWRVRAATAKADDGPARRALAELAADLGLYAIARAEFEKALALGAIDAASYRAEVADAERRAIETGIARAQRAADAGDVETALAVARELKIDFASAVDAPRVEALLATLVARIGDRDRDQSAAKAEVEKVMVEAEKQKRIERHRFEARRQTAAGDRAAADARAQMPNAVVSRVRRHGEAAADAYEDARRALGRLRRIAGPTGALRDETTASLGDLDRRQYAFLFEAAKFFWDARVYATAEEFAARAAFVDPVDPRLLELRDEMRNVRMRRRLSDVTNARPR